MFSVNLLADAASPIVSGFLQFCGVFLLFFVGCLLCHWFVAWVGKALFKKDLSEDAQCYATAVLFMLGGIALSSGAIFFGGLAHGGAAWLFRDKPEEAAAEPSSESDHSMTVEAERDAA